MRNRFKGAALALSLAVAALPASAAVVFVDKYSPGPTHDGKSWQTAYTTIVSGYTAAKTGDEVWVGPGAYAELITMKPNVSLYGGFIGYEVVRDMRVGIQGLTTLSVGSQSATSVVTASLSTITTATVLDGFTFQQDGTLKVGSAVYCQQASLTISHNVFKGLVVYNPVIYSVSGNPVITDNIIMENGGGSQENGVPAINISSASGTIVNNTIVGNSGIAITGAGTILVANNIVAYNRGAFQLSSIGVGHSPVYHNNCLYANTLTSPQYVNPTGQDGNITADPRFSVYAYGNLHIAPDSPCRDAGDDTAVAAGDTDIDLQPRIQGAHVDIGADESDGRIWTFNRRIVRVSPTGNDANDGSSWALAKKSLQAGIDFAALYGGDVWVQTGTYSVPGTVRSPINLKPFCYLYGGFAGTETAFNQRDWLANPTILSGLKVPILAATAGYRVSALDGFILTGGVSSSLAGAGVTCAGASPYIRNNVFTRNTGPVVYCAVSNPVLTNNAFYNNVIATPAYIVGGTFCALTVVGNVFSANGPAAALQPLGCVFGDKNSTLLVTDNLFQDNSVGSTTASLATSGVQGSGIVANNTFVNNRGVALYLLAGTAANNIVAFNEAGIDPSTVSTIISNCAYGNTTDYGQSNRAGKDGNISVYPMFSSLLFADYRLMDASPCVDAGRDTYVSPGELDLDGSSRIQGRAVDMGCYESSASSMVAHWDDIARALRIAGGLTEATPQDVSLLNRVTEDVTQTLGLPDAEVLIRQFSTQTQ